MAHEKIEKKDFLGRTDHFQTTFLKKNLETDQSLEKQTRSEGLKTPGPLSTGKKLIENIVVA